VIEPQIVIGNGHFVKRHALGIFKKTVGPPDVVQPLHIQDPVVFLHVFRESETRVSPALRQEDVSDVSLEKRRQKWSAWRMETCHGLFVDGVQREYGDVEVDHCRLALQFGGSIFVVVFRFEGEDVSEGETDFFDVVARFGIVVATKRAFRLIISFNFKISNKGKGRK
jgi:hypothetical protein